ncbi:SH3 domain-containing protein [uncultured Clostridium sp.]|uniref:SH3 domain-containing protein n=1 Tax=uncultured Clostridium sp. TaxID=59620 RepID=UPI002619D790|nr:SH3 domain-containing protein [uncultured Clostridium sp.]
MKSKKISLLVVSAAIASFAVSFTPGITAFADTLNHQSKQTAPIEMFAKTTVNSTYSNVKYDYTMAKYAAAEMKSYGLNGGSQTKATLDSMLQAINPQYASSVFEFLRVDTFRNVNTNKVTNFLNGKGVFSGQADTFINAAKEYNLDPVYFISQSGLETGWGSSNFAKGITIDQIAVPVTKDGKTTYTTKKLNKPTTVYNLFGIGADNGNPTLMATTYAYNHGWTSVSKAIYGAAQFLSENYVHNTDIAQNTPYELRFIDAPSQDIWHQYSTDIEYASKIGSIINDNKDLYASNDLFDFNIPKFETSTTTPNSSSTNKSTTSKTTPVVSPISKSTTSKETPTVSPASKSTTSKETPAVSPVSKSTTSKTTPAVSPASKSITPKTTPTISPASKSTTSDSIISTSPTLGNIVQYTDAMSEPTWNSSVITTIPFGQNITLTGYTTTNWNGWVRATYNNQTVWIPASRVISKGQTEYSSIGTGVVNFNDGSNVLTENNWNSRFLTFISSGTQVNITGESNGWYRIDYLNMSGWIPMNRVDNSAAYKVTPINKQGIIEMPGGAFTYAKDIPSWNGYITEKLFNGTHVNIIGSYNGWDKISVDNQILWVPNNRIQSNGLNTPIGYGISEFPSVGYTDVMSTPTWDTSLSGTLQDGSYFKILAQKDGWYQIETFGYDGSLPLLGWLPMNRVVTSLNKAYIGTGLTSMYSDIMSSGTWYSNVTSTLPSNTYVNIISIKDGWCQISYNNGTAWIPLSRVSLLNSLNKKTTETGIISFSQNPYTDVMYEDSWNSNLAGTLNNGAKVQIVGQKNGWTEINYQSTTAWIPSNRIQTGTIKTINFSLGYSDVMSEDTWYSTIETSLNNNTTVVVLSTTNGWSKIAFDGITGWIPSNRLS